MKNTYQSLVQWFKDNDIKDYNKYIKNKEIIYLYKYYILEKKQISISDNILDYKPKYRSIYYTFIGLYYQKQGLFDLMKIYYNLAIELNNSDAMFYIGYYYHINEYNITNFTKYYKMAIKNNNPLAMRYMAFYYQYSFDNNHKNSIKVKKYYKMAIKLNDPESIINLADYYVYNENKPNKTKKLLKIGIVLKIPSAYENMAEYYKYYKPSKINKIEKYYKIAISMVIKNSRIVHELCYYYLSQNKLYKMKQCFLKNKKLSNIYSFYISRNYNIL